MMSRTAVITGASGFIGTNIMLRLLREDIRIVAVYHRRQPKYIDDRITWVQADLSKAKECDSVFKKAAEVSENGEIDYLVMTAAYVGGAEKLLNSPMAFVTDTTVLNLYVLQSAYRFKVHKTLYVSSGMGYAESREPLVEERAMEGEPYEKYYFGGWSRRYIEVVCRMYAEKIKDPMNISVIRIDNVYGPYDSFAWEKSHVAAALIRKVVERHNPVEVWGDGKDYKDFIYVEDLAEGAVLALENAKGFHLYNIASGKNVTVNELLSMILEADNYTNAKIVYNATKPTMIPYKVTSIEKAKKELGFHPSVELRDGLIRTIRWYRAQTDIS